MPEVTYGFAREEDRAELLALIDRVFGEATGLPFDFARLLPKVYGPEVRGMMQHHVVTRCEGRLIGTIGCCPTTIMIAGQRLQVGYVGSVAVAPAHRGEGHMKAMMRILMQKAEADGCELLFLGGQRQRYEHFGFTQGGLVVRYRLTRRNLKSPVLREAQAERIRFLPFEAADAETIARLAALSAAQTVTAERRRFADTLRSYDAVPRVILRDGEAIGYVSGRPNGEITELVVRDPACLVDVFRALLDEMPSVTIPLSCLDTELRASLAPIAEATELQQLGMLRILRWQPVTEKLLRAQRRLADGCVTFRVQETGETFTVRVTDGVPAVGPAKGAPEITDTAAELKRLWFGLDSLLSDRLPRGWAPLPLFIREADMF